MSTKKCPFCAEEVQLEAVKCKHCGSMIGPVQRPAGFGPQPQGGQSYWDGAQRDVRPANQPNFAPAAASRQPGALTQGQVVAIVGGIVLVAGVLVMSSNPKGTSSGSSVAAPALTTEPETTTVEQHAARICGGPRPEGAYALFHEERVDSASSPRMSVHAVVRRGLDRQTLARAACYAAFDGYERPLAGGGRAGASSAYVFAACQDASGAVSAAKVDLAPNGALVAADPRVPLEKWSATTMLAEEYFQPPTDPAAQLKWAKAQAAALLREGRAMDSLRNSGSTDGLQRCGERMRELQPRARALGACSSVNVNVPELTPFRAAAVALEMCTSCVRGGPDVALSAAAACARAEEALKQAR